MVYRVSTSKRNNPVKPVNPAPAPVAAISAADFRMFEERTKGPKLPKGKVPRTAPVLPRKPVAAPTAPAPAKVPGDVSSALMGLSTEQMTQVAEERDKLQRQYDLLMNTVTRDTAQAQAERDAAYMAAAQQAAGQNQDLLTQLASIGMEGSQGLVAVGAGDIGKQRAMQEAQAARGLGQLLGELESRKLQGATEFEQGKLDLNRLAALLRIQRTQEEQKRLQDLIGGI